jgi:NAD+ synthase (glutamine-hydrolysing)
MGMTYQELTIFGRLRKLNKLGPFGMFQRLVHDWSIDRERKPNDDAPYYTPTQVAEKVKKFFHFYAINSTYSTLGLGPWVVTRRVSDDVIGHKMTTLTPALHCNDYCKCCVNTQAEHGIRG